MQTPPNQESLSIFDTLLKLTSENASFKYCKECPDFNWQSSHCVRVIPSVENCLLLTALYPE